MPENTPQQGLGASNQAASGDAATPPTSDLPESPPSAAAEQATQESIATEVNATAAELVTPPPIFIPPPSEPSTPAESQAPYQSAPGKATEKGAYAYQIGDEHPWRTLVNVVSARLRSVSHRAARSITNRTLKIGISARIFHPQAGAKGLPSKTLQYLEESIAQWVMSRDVMVFMIPSVNTSGLIRPSNIRLRDYAKHLDGLVLQGGADVAPESYSQAATRPEWAGDRTRDMYELELLHEFIEADKPLLGICRGCQLLNVAFGGSLYQDIATEMPSAIRHVHELYDQHSHDLRFTEQSSLARLLSLPAKPRVNSIHHQAIKNLGRDMVIEAVSAEDNVVEAIRYRRSNFVVGLQWHPEFHQPERTGLLDCTPILDGFLRAARETRF